MEELIAAQNGTLLGHVNEAFLKGEFVCPFDEKIGENETPIGVLISYERAIVVAMQQLIDSHNQAVRNHETNDKMFLKKGDKEFYTKLLWSSICSRFELETSAELCLREDWVITSKNKQEDMTFGHEWMAVYSIRLGQCEECLLAGICPGSLICSV